MILSPPPLSLLSKSIAAILRTADFEAPLITSLQPTKGVGTPAFTRGTTATVEVNDGANGLILRTAKIGEARFPGALRVENLLQNTTTLVTQSVTVVSGNTYTLSFWGTGSVALSGAYSGALAGTGASNRVQVTFTGASTTLTLTVTGSVTSAQLENVTGQSVQTAGEYVSNGAIRRNLLTWSEDLTKSVYSSAASLTANTITANNVSYGGFVSASSYNFIAGATYSASIEVKKINHDYFGFGIGFSRASDFSLHRINLATGGLTSVTPVRGTVISFEAELLTDGFYRLKISYVPSLTEPVASIRFGLLSSSGRGDWTPTGGESVFIRNAQFEKSVSTTAYQKITDASPVDFNNYHGAGVDGVKYFDTKLDGSAIADSTLKGVLAEGSSTNLLTYSEQFDNVVWEKLGELVKTGGFSDPRGGLSAFCLSSETTAQHAMYTSGSFTATIGQNYTFSIFLKKGSDSWVQLTGASGMFGVNSWANINLDTLSIGHSSNLIDYNFDTDLTGDWVRVSVTFTATGTSGTAVTVALLGNADPNLRIPSVIASPLGAVYIWGAQLEASSFPSSYIPTISAALARNKDETVFPSSIISDAAGSATMEIDCDYWASIAGQYIGDGTEALLKPIGSYLGASYDGTNTINGPAGTPASKLKLGITWSAATGKQTLVVNGVAGAEGNYDGSWNLASAILGDSSSIYVKNLRTWTTTQKSVAELRTVTK